MHKVLFLLCYYYKISNTISLWSMFNVYACKMKPFIFTQFIVTSKSFFYQYSFPYTDSKLFLIRQHFYMIHCLSYCFWHNMFSRKLVHFLCAFSQKKTSRITLSCSKPFGVYNKITEMLFCVFQLALDLCVMLMAMLQFAIII